MIFKVPPNTNHTMILRNKSGNDYDSRSKVLKVHSTSANSHLLSLICQERNTHENMQGISQPKIFKEKKHSSLYVVFIWHFKPSLHGA